MRIKPFTIKPDFKEINEKKYHPRQKLWNSAHLEDIHFKCFFFLAGWGSAVNKLIIDEMQNICSFNS